MLSEKLKLESWDNMETQTIDEATDHLHNTIVKHLDKIAPMETRFLKPRPVNNWMTPGIKNSIVTSDQMFRQVKQGKLLKETHKNYKSILDSTIQLARNNYYQKSITSAGNNSRKLWQIVNEMRQST